MTVDQTPADRLEPGERLLWSGGPSAGIPARYTHYRTSVLLADADRVSERIDLALKRKADDENAPDDREADF